MGEFLQSVTRALTACGMQAQAYATNLCPVDTGKLRQSISYEVTSTECCVGTNLEYAPYVEFGTGIYYEGGRQTPWVYQDAKGNWHLTHGSKAQPFLKPAVADHGDTYRRIIESELKG